MRYRQNTNENRGLSYYEQNFQVMGQAMGVDLADWKKDPVFNSIALALAGKVATRLKALDMLPITANPSYIPGFIRDYMDLAVVNDEAFTMKRLDEYWLPAMEKKGYNPTIARALFVAFDELHKSNMVPMRIWKPSSKSGIVKMDTDGVTVMGQKLNWWLLGGIGVAVLAAGGFIIFKKR